LSDFYYKCDKTLLQKHNIPVSAIPCLQYRRALEAEAARANELQQSSADDNGDHIYTGSSRGQWEPCPPNVWWNFLFCKKNRFYSQLADFSGCDNAKRL